MVNLNKISKAARSAAMRGGTSGWGQYGSDAEHIRYMESLPAKSRRRCYCGCHKRATHRGMANGVALSIGCELSIRRWAKNSGHANSASRMIATHLAAQPAQGEGEK